MVGKSVQELFGNNLDSAIISGFSGGWSNKDFEITVRRPSLKCTVPKFRGVEQQCQIIPYDKSQISMSI
jgi:hypothetical protein